MGSLNVDSLLSSSNKTYSGSKSIDIDELLGKKKSSSLFNIDKEKENKLEGNILTDITSGLNIGTQSAIADSIAGIQATGTQLGIPTPKEAQILKQWFRGNISKEASEHPIARADFSEHPIRKSIFNVSAAAPMMVAAFATSQKTKKPLAGASIFGPGALGSFYDEAVAQGKSHEEAFTPALINSVSQVALENIPLTGFLKGGSLVKRIARGIIQEGLIEEGTQQLVQNTLEAMTWKGYDNFAKELVNDVTESVVAGSVMGAGMGAISPASWDDVRYDVFRSSEKIKNKIIDKARAEGRSEAEIGTALKTIDTLIDTFIKDKNNNAYKAHLSKLLKQNQKLLESRIELSFSNENKEGVSKDLVNESSLLPDKLRRESTDLVKTMEKGKYEEYPVVLQDMMVNWVASELDKKQLTQEQITKEFEAMKSREWLTPDKIYVSGIEKGSEGKINPDTNVYSGSYGWTTIKNLGERLKMSEPNSDGTMRYSVAPYKYVVAHAVKNNIGKRVGLSDTVRVALTSAYKNSSAIEQLPEQVDAINQMKAEQDSKDTQQILEEHKAIKDEERRIASDVRDKLNEQKSIIGDRQSTKQYEDLKFSFNYSPLQKTQTQKPIIQEVLLTPEQQQIYDRFSPLAKNSLSSQELPNTTPRTITAKALTSAMKWSRYPGAIRNFLNTFFGEKEINKILQEEKKIDLKDEVVSAIYTDKAFRRLASHMAWEQTRPIFETVWEVSQRMAQGDKKSAQAIYDKLTYLMQLASEEIYSESGSAEQIAHTKIGVGGEHLQSHKPLADIANPEAHSYVKDMIDMHQAFNIKFDESDIKRWSKGRDTLSFYNILKQIDPKLTNALSWVKAEIEYPLLKAQMDEGVFYSENMWENISRGYAHRVFVMKREQAEGAGGKSKANVGNSLASRSIAQADYRTLSESVFQTEAEGMTPVKGIVASQQEYIKESLLRLQQAQTIGLLQQLSPVNVRQLVGYESNAKVNDIIAKLRYVEYTDSENIKELAKETKLTPNDILERLGYSQANEAPGLVEWSKGLFRQPYMNHELRQFINSVFEPKMLTEGALGKFNAITNYFKRMITVNPFDSTFLWMTPVIVNSPLFVLEIPGLAFEQLRVAGKGVKEGLNILRGKDWLHKSDIIGEGYENLPLFVKHGFSTMNYEQAMQSLWDKEVLGKFPELTTPFERGKEYFGTLGGINRAIFQNLIAKKLYHVVNARYKQFVNMGIDKETAARRAVKLVNDTSFMLNPDVWGKEGKFFTSLFFTRNLTVGFIRQLTAVMHPIAKLFGIKHKNRPGAITNSLFHGEASQADMDFLAKYYVQHVAKTMLASVMINGLIQYALSFLDDDKKDEHGEIGRGNLLAKKRFMMMNEPGKKFAIRTPWKEMTSRRMYIDFQLLRESRQIGNLFFDSLEDIPNNMKDWGKNRMNTLLKVFAEVLLNVDSSGKEIINNKADLPVDMQIEIYKDYFGQQMIPLGFGLRKEEKSYTGNKKLDDALRIIEIFGANKKYGMPLEEGAKIEDMKTLRRAIAEKAYTREKATKDIRWMTNKEIINIIGPDFTIDSAENQLIKRYAPYYDLLMKNQNAWMEYFMKHKAK